MNYRKKPVVIEATEWQRNGDHPLDDVMRPFEDTGKVPDSPREGAVVRYFRHPGVSGEKPCEHCGQIMRDHGWIDTLEGGHIVCPGDFVITGVKGERYPCKPDMFAATYEAVTAIGERDAEIEALKQRVQSQASVIGALGRQVERLRDVKWEGIIELETERDQLRQRVNELEEKLVHEQHNVAELMEAIRERDEAVETPTNNGWIRMADRLPTKEDGDCYEAIWARH